MGEQVESLEAGRLGKVCRVGVGWEGEVSVGGVGQSKVGDEVVEAPIVSRSNRANLS